MEKTNIAIIGSGSYSTGIVKILTDNKQAGIGNIGNLHWYVRRAEALEHIRKFKHNPNYLSSVELHTDSLILSSDLKACIAPADWVLIGVPSAFVNTVLKDLQPKDLVGKKLITVVKGLVPETNEIIADYLYTKFAVPYENICMITGPSHAEEIALEKLTYLTFASSPVDLAKTMNQTFSNHYINTTTTNDLKGAEYAAVLKNVFALAAGIYHGLGYGDNFHAFFITNALKEMKKFVSKVSPMERDIEDAAYLGDLLATGYSSFSRNRMFGNLIGKGYTVTAAKAEMNMIAEGYYATGCMHEINKIHQVDLPILDAVYEVLYQHSDTAATMQKLTERLY